MNAYALSERELATVLAALRHFQETIDVEERADSEYFADVQPLTDPQIDRLCERLTGYGIGGPAAPSKRRASVRDPK